MTATPDIAEDTAPDAADFARPTLERQMARLDELADLGMDIARTLRDRAADPQVAPADISLAFSRVSRAVRMTMALQSEVIDQLRTTTRLEAGAVSAAESTQAARRDHKARIGQALTDIVAREHEADEGSEAHERHVREASERLRDVDNLGDILSRPVEEVIAQICRDLGLSGEKASSFSSAQPVEGVQPPPAASPETPQGAHSVTTLARRATFPASGAGEDEWIPPPPYVPPPDPDILPGYEWGLPGELPPPRPPRPKPYWQT